MENIKQTNWEVYIIQTESGKLYTGISTDVERRFNEHKTADTPNSKAAKFFRANKPSKIIFREQHPNRSSATKREMQIKGLLRQDKLALSNI